jgi:antitoxin component YwqK of YwqJK toxin-antitoxin module
MRKFLSTVFTVCFCMLLQAQTFELAGVDTINRTDKEGKKQGKWVVLGKMKPGGCYQPESKIETGKYTDNRKEGIWTEYYCNGNMKCKLTFVNGRADGFAQMFHENGKISEEGNWKNSRWTGNYKLYYDNGQVQHEFAFTASGKREGNQKYYYPNGQLAIEGEFQNGKESGIIKEYFENGDIKAEKNYADGNVDVSSIREYQPKKPVVKREEEADNAPPVKVTPDEKPNEAAMKAAASKGPLLLNGQHTLYNKNKQLSKDGIFKDNTFMEGKAYIYDDNGILKRIAVYRNGRYVGDTQIED